MSVPHKDLTSNLQRQQQFKTLRMYTRKGHKELHALGVQYLPLLLFLFCSKSTIWARSFCRVKKKKRKIMHECMCASMEGGGMWPWGSPVSWLVIGELSHCHCSPLLHCLYPRYGMSGCHVCHLGRELCNKVMCTCYTNCYTLIV